MAPGHPVEPSEADEDPEFAAEREFYRDLAQRLKEAHRQANALPESVRIPVIRKLLMVTERAKRDPVQASERLDRMLVELATTAKEAPTR
ncbi:ABC transporter substrate-binding protein [Thermobifida alba]|uniref:ABC transporter substrate-binding protein n=1 Tax=Thermobifida alba TaxID=53522 RepID=UPI0020C064C5|nr:ABC transporter substrate-binding protein [Thermobifida alba]HLU96774.1 ABC transporter substrate-binding protein [Thermobifida alba]